MFKPWDKRTRGRHADHPGLELTSAVSNYVGKVVYVLDDISTTNKTLQAAVQGLMRAGVHAHGLVWVYYA